MCCDAIRGHGNFGTVCTREFQEAAGESIARRVFTRRLYAQFRAFISSKLAQTRDSEVDREDIMTKNDGKINKQHSRLWSPLGSLNPTQSFVNPEMSDKVEVEPKKWDLEPESEYRFELDAGTSLAIKVSFHQLQWGSLSSPESQLLDGHAEIFGFELVEGKTYLFGFECKAAVFTWQGCAIEMSLPFTHIPIGIGWVCVFTLRAYPLQNTSPMKPLWKYMRICTSL